MLPHRKLLLILTILLVGGSLSWTSGYAWHLRSEAYRAEVEARLNRFFELPCKVGRIRGHTFTSRLFEDVEVWLPDRRDRIFACDEAVWREVREDGGEVNELDLSKGRLVLGTERWQGGDYQQVFRSGLGHDFDDLNLTAVRLANFQILFDRGSVSINCGDVSGRIDMSNPADGVAHLVAYELDGHRVNQGLKIDASFLPRNGVDVSELVLTLPEVPLACLGIRKALKTDVSSGRFAGRMQFLKGQDAPEFWIDGKLEDAELSELTAFLPIGPLSGRLTVNVYAARIAEGRITHFRGRGSVEALDLSAFAPLVGTPTLSGAASLNIDAIDLSLGHINRLRLEGSARDLQLQEWLAMLGQGSATGRLAIRVNNLEILNDDIKSADVEVNVTPPAGQAGIMDRQILLSAAEKMFQFTWPPALPKELLPEHIEYTQCGMRLLVQDNLLRILGTHGPGNDTILTIDVFGTPVGVIKEQGEAVDLGPYLRELLDRARSYDSSRMRGWWESRTKIR